MKKQILVSLLLLIVSVSLHAQTDVLIEVDTGRTMNGSVGAIPVLHRAILTMPAAPTDTALLYFRGLPGYMLISSLQDKQRNLQWLAKGENDLLQAGIAIVLMDCPTDQLGSNPAPPATNCLGDYRGSKPHADDVRRIMARLKEQYGLSRIYILGHSIGTISSRWLAINLGKDEIAGTIHSSTINVINRETSRLQLGNLLNEFPSRATGAPMLYIDNERDACPSTPYDLVRNYAKDNLVTVRGGIAEGNPCGGGHLHSHQGREEVVVKAIITWIKTKKVETFVGE